MLLTFSQTTSRFHSFDRDCRALPPPGAEKPQLETIRFADYHRLPESPASLTLIPSGSRPERQVILASLRHPPGQNVGTISRIRRNEVAHVLDNPRIGIATVSNIRKARRTSATATSCGVVTRTAPCTGTSCAGQLHVAFREACHNEIIELAPLHIRKKLFDEAVQDRRARSRLVARLQESHGHILCHELRWEPAYAFDNRLRIADAKHDGNIGP